MGNIPADSVLLCESCGYDVSGLAEHTHCPECGRPIADSIPERRTGSPWQAARSPRAWALTNFLMLRHPGPMFDRLRMDRRGTRSLLLSNLLLAGAILASPWIDTLIGFPARNLRNAPFPIMALAYTASAAMGTLAVAGFLFLLTLIEVNGITFFGRRRGWRITPAIAWQICAHASVGWIIAAALSLTSLIVWLNVSYFGQSGWIERAGPIAKYLLGSIPLIGFLAGMLIFEVLVYTGMRRCRYANAPRPP